MPPSPPPPPVDLKALQDIVLPASVSFLPRTPGFYLLLALLLALVAWLVFRYRSVRAGGRYRREAMAELEQLVQELEKKGGRYVLAARLPELLKRVALHVEPRAAVASITDADWLHELDRMYGGDGFSKGPGRVLPRLAYGTHASIANVQRADIDALVRLSRDWIRKHQPVPFPAASKAAGAVDRA